MVLRVSEVIAELEEEVFREFSCDVSYDQGWECQFSLVSPLLSCLIGSEPFLRKAISPRRGCRVVGKTAQGRGKDLGDFTLLSVNKCLKLG